MDTDKLIGGYPRYLALAKKLLQNEEDAKDVVQDAVLACLELKSVKDPAHYCLRSVRNRCFSLLRKRGTMTPFEVSEVWNQMTRESVRRATLEEKLELLRLLKNKLNAWDRAVVELHFEDGLSLDQVAAMTARSRSTIVRIIARTKAILKAGLAST